MSISIPPISEVRTELQTLGHADLQRLAKLSGVPFTTLWKIRSGITGNPGIETVRLFHGHVRAVSAALNRRKLDRRATDKAGV